jgi:hypothetical protein
VQRRASNTGIVMVVGRKIALGRLYRHRTLTVNVSDTTLAIELDEGEVKVVRRTNRQPVRMPRRRRMGGRTTRVGAAGPKVCRAKRWRGDRPKADVAPRNTQTKPRFSVRHACHRVD